MSSKLTEEFLDEEYSEEGWWLKEGYANPEDVPVPDWHIAILEERRALYQSEDITKWPTWEEVQEELMREITEERKKRQK